MTKLHFERFILAIAAVTMLSACGPSGGLDAGDYVVHFNALATEMLPAEVARAYGIVRSDSRAMLNVSIVRKQADTIGKPVGAAVTVNASNLTGQLKSVTVRRIEEGNAIYYIGEISVANQETLIFDIEVTPEGETRPISVKFRQQFYTD